jgi:hypothetical protein
MALDAAELAYRPVVGWYRLRLSLPIAGCRRHVTQSTGIPSLAGQYVQKLASMLAGTSRGIQLTPYSLLLRLMGNAIFDGLPV